MSTSILYQNESKDIVLVDIPTSIAIAQDRKDETLLSSLPQAEPFISHNEPKSEKARQKLAGPLFLGAYQMCEYFYRSLFLKCIQFEHFLSFRIRSLHSSLLDQGRFSQSAD